MTDQFHVCTTETFSFKQVSQKHNYMPHIRPWYTSNLKRAPVDYHGLWIREDNAKQKHSVLLNFTLITRKLVIRYSYV